MNYKCTFLIAILAITGFGKASFAGDSAGSDNSNDIKTRLQKAERARDTRLLKELCVSADPSDLNIADAVDEDTALLMLERGADVNKPCEVCLNAFTNDRGTTALHAAAYWNSPRLIDALLKKGAKVDVKGKMEKDTPLHIAAYFGSPEAVERLLKAGANPNLECAYGNALTSAVFAQLHERHVSDAKNQRYLKVMRSLVAAGADVHGILNKYTGESISDMVLQNKDPVFMQQARLALGFDQATNATSDGKNATNQQALSGEQVGIALTTSSFNNLSVLAPLLKHSDPDVRFRALQRINEIAEERGGGMKLDSQLYFELDSKGVSTTLLDRKWFSPELMSSIVSATDDPVPKVRGQAHRVLSIIDPVDNDIIKLMTNKLSSDSDPKVRLRCAETLGWLATTQRKDSMSEIAKSVQSAVVHDDNAQTRLGEGLVLQYLHKETQPNHSAHEKSDPTMLAQEFGIPRSLLPANMITVDTRQIPCRKDTLYRVSLVPDYYSGPVHITLKLTMPYARKHWLTAESLWKDKVWIRPDGTSAHYRENAYMGCNLPQKVDVSADGRVGTYKEDFQDGGISGVYAATWPVDEEDRPGKCKLEVFLNDRLTKTFDFDLVASD